MNEAFLHVCLGTLSLIVILLGYLLFRTTCALNQTRLVMATPTPHPESPLPTVLSSPESASASAHLFRPSDVPCLFDETPCCEAGRPCVSGQPPQFSTHVPLVGLLDRDDLLAARDGLWDWDRATDELHFNPRFLGMLGYSPDAFPQNQDTWRNLLHPDDRESAQHRQSQMLESSEYGDSFEHIFRLRAADGSYRWFLGQILNVRRDCDGRALRVVGANVDITDLKQLREKVADEDTLLKKTLDNTSDGTWEWFIPDDAPRDISCLFTMLGSTDETPASNFTSWSRRIHSEDRDLAVALQVRIMNSVGNGDCAECTYRYQVCDGTYRWMLGRTSVVLRNKEGRAQRVVGVHTDVTELKALHSELNVRSERLNYAFAAARDGLWDWDVEQNDVYFSPRYLTMVGYTPEQFPSEQSAWENAIHPEDRERVLAHQNMFMESPLHGDSFENTYRFRASDGSYRWIMARALVVRRDATGRGQRLVGLHTDITEMRRTQESLRILLQHDSLTGLYSRSYFEARMAALSDGKQDPVSLIICDVDGLKLINDNLGHAEGDRLLVNTASVLSTAVRGGDVVARIGGDEIAILLPVCPSDPAAKVLAKLQAALDEHNKTTPHPLIYISMGLATAELTHTSSEALFRKADKAMLKNKYVSHAKNHACITKWLENHLGHLIEGTDSRLC